MTTRQADNGQLNITCLKGSEVAWQDANYFQQADGLPAVSPLEANVAGSSTPHSNPAAGKPEAATPARHRICARFIYLAADPANRVVKVGVSLNPERRIAGIAFGRSVFYRDHKHYSSLRFRPVQVWPIGVLSFSASLLIEQALHQHLRSLVSFHDGEFYRLAPSRARQAVSMWLSQHAKAA